MRSAGLIFLGLMFVLSFQCGKNHAEKRQDNNQDSTVVDSIQNDSLKGDKDKAGKMDKKFSEDIPVQVVMPQKGDIESYLIYSSNVDVEQIADIHPMASGIVTKILKDEGQTVRKGETLARLDDREASINEAKAENNYSKLKVEFERQKQMYEKKLISKEEFETFQYNLEAAKLDWKQSELMLSYTKIQSPFNGVVANRYIKVGNRINTTDLAFKVIQNSDKIAVVYVPQEEKESIRKGQKVIVNSDYHTIDAEVIRFSPAIDPSTGTFKVTIGMKDPQDHFLVGQFVNVRIVKDVHENTILLNKETLIFDADKIFVFVIDEQNLAQKKEIIPGFESGNEIEVLQGITIDDKVVTAGKNSLKNQSKVKIVEMKENNPS